METPAFPTVTGSFIGWLVSPATERAVPNETALPPVVITRSTANKSLNLVFMRLYPPATAGYTDTSPCLVPARSVTQLVRVKRRAYSTTEQSYARALLAANQTTNKRGHRI